MADHRIPDDLLSRIGWTRDAIVGAGIANAAVLLSVAEMERIAALLTADDEQRELDAMRDRANDEWQRKDLTAIHLAALRAWDANIPDVADDIGQLLDRLKPFEAAYRAAVDQG